MQVYRQAVIKQLIQALFKFSKLQFSATFTYTQVSYMLSYEMKETDCMFQREDFWWLIEQDHR